MRGIAMRGWFGRPPSSDYKLTLPQSPVSTNPPQNINKDNTFTAQEPVLSLLISIQNFMWPLFSVATCSCLISKDNLLWRAEGRAPFLVLFQGLLFGRDSILFISLFYYFICIRGGCGAYWILLVFLLKHTFNYYYWNIFVHYTSQFLFLINFKKRLSMWLFFCMLRD